MDIKDIIKWFIPCFHLLLRFARMNVRLTFVCLFLLFSCPSYAGKVNSEKDVGFSDKHSTQLNIFSDYYNYNQSNVPLSEEESSFEGDTSIGKMRIKIKVLPTFVIKTCFRISNKVE